MRFVRKDDMNPIFASYYNRDAIKLITEIYVKMMQPKVEYRLSPKNTTLVYNDKLDYSGKHIALGHMPYNAKHLINLQDFLLWAAKQKDLKE